MAKIKYQAKENTKVGTHSFYASPVFAGTLTTDEVLEEALDGKSIEPSIARAAISEYMKAVQRNVMKGFRCQLGDNFLTIYPNLKVSVKDKENADGTVTVATADMLNAANGRSRLGCTVSSKFSMEFATSVQWQKIGDIADGSDDEGEDVTEENQTNAPTGGNSNDDDELTGD